jgi:Zn-dependent protease
VLGRSWKLGRVAGIDIFVHPTFFLLLAWAVLFAGGFDVGLLICALFGCVVLHELGHALAARGYGIATRDITLYPIGGVARLERMPRSSGPEIVISVAGPLVNLAIAAGIAVVLRLGSLIDPGAVGSDTGQFLAQLAEANIFLAVFNMIPAFPMDGGRIVRALLSGLLGRVRATEVAATLGQALAVILPLVLYALHQFSPIHLLLALFVFYAARAERAAVVAEEAWTARANGRAFRGGTARPSGAPVATAPPGYHWVSRGAGIWQLVPVVAHSKL